MNERYDRLKKDDDRKDTLNALALVSQLGLSMAACVILGVLGGRQLDKWLGTSPLLLIIGSFVGAAAAFKVLYDLAVKKWMK